MNIHMLLYAAAALYAAAFILHLLKNGRVAFISLCTGFALHTVYQVSRGWITVFFLSEVTGQAFFYLAAWFAAVGIATKRESNGYHSLIVWGFVLYSIAQVTGAVWKLPSGAIFTGNV